MPATAGDTRESQASRQHPRAKRYSNATGAQNRSAACKNHFARPYAPAQKNSHVRKSHRRQLYHWRPKANASKTRSLCVRTQTTPHVVAFSHQQPCHSHPKPPSAALVSVPRTRRGCAASSFIHVVSPPGPSIPLDSHRFTALGSNDGLPSTLVPLHARLLAFFTIVNFYVNFHGAYALDIRNPNRSTAAAQRA